MQLVLQSPAHGPCSAGPARLPLWPVRWFSATTLAGVVLMAGCGSVPISSLWKLRKLSLEALEPAAMRAAVVHSPRLQLSPHSAFLTVAVSRKLRLPNGSTTTERLEEKLPLQALHSSAERRPLIDHESPQTTVHLWRIDPTALPQLQALRTRAMAWKGTDDGQRELSLGVELAGCQKAGSTRQTITTLIRFTEAGEYIPIVRNIDLAETLSAAELKQRFPVCSTAGVLPAQRAG